MTLSSLFLQNVNVFRVDCFVVRQVFMRAPTSVKGSSSYSTYLQHVQELPDAVCRDDTEAASSGTFSTFFFLSAFALLVYLRTVVEFKRKSKWKQEELNASLFPEPTWLLSSLSDAACVAAALRSQMSFP